MSDTRIFFHSNIRLLRERRKLSQEELASRLEMTRNKLQALESGKTVNPSAADLVAFSEFFKVSIDSLMKVDLSKLGELKLQDLLSGNDVYMRGTNIRVLAITVDKTNLENTEYVPVKAKAGYRSSYNDPEFIAKLPKFSLPNLPPDGTYRMFPTTGDSMLPIPEGSDVIAQYAQDWKNIKPDTPCIVILAGEQDFVFKLVTIQKDRKLLLKSLNKAYEPYTVDAKDVLEIWKYYKHQTGILPQPETKLEELKTLILNLRKDIIG